MCKERVLPESSEEASRDGKNQMYALNDKRGKVITNSDKIIIVADEFYRDLYSSHGILDNT